MAFLRESSLLLGLGFISKPRSFPIAQNRYPISVRPLGVGISVLRLVAVAVGVI